MDTAAVSAAAELVVMEAAATAEVARAKERAAEATAVAAAVTVVPTAPKRASKIITFCCRATPRWILNRSLKSMPMK